MPDRPIPAPSSAVFSALGDPIRRLMLERLLDGEQSASALGDDLPISQPAASQHLRVLREAGLVAWRKEGRRRIYRLEPAPLKGVHDWLAHYRAHWEDRIDDLERDLHLSDTPDAG